MLNAFIIEASFFASSKAKDPVSKLVKPGPPKSLITVPFIPRL